MGGFFIESNVFNYKCGQNTWLMAEFKFSH